MTSSDRNARLYLTGLAFSLVGNSALSLVAGIWVKSLTGSSGEAGWVSVCIYAPSLTGPLAGIVADRVRRRRFLVGLNLASAVALLPLLAVDGPDRVWIVFVVMGGYGTSLVLSGPAESALFVEMLPEDVRLRVNGLYLGLQEVGRLVAPLVGAALFVAAGGGVVALVDAGTFGVAAATTAGLRLGPAPVAAQVPARRWRRDLVAGFVHIRSRPQLRRVTIIAALTIGISGLGVAAQYSLVQALGRSPSFLGVLSACLGGGSILASVTSSRLLRFLGVDRLALIGVADFALGTLLRTTGTLAGAIAGSVVLGFALPWVFLAALTTAQRDSPVELQGRVSAALTLALFAPQAPIQALGALAIDPLGYRTIFLIETAFALATIAWFGRHRAVPGEE